MDSSDVPDQSSSPARVPKTPAHHPPAATTFVGSRRATIDDLLPASPCVQSIPRTVRPPQMPCAPSARTTPRCPDSDRDNAGFQISDRRPQILSPLPGKNPASTAQRPDPNQTYASAECLTVARSRDECQTSLPSVATTRRYPGNGPSAREYC